MEATYFDCVHDWPLTSWLPCLGFDMHCTGSTQPLAMKRQNTFFSFRSKSPMLGILCEVGGSVVLKLINGNFAEFAGAVKF